MKRIFFVVLAASLITSCTIEQNINFKQDNSGDYSVKLDLSLATSLMDDSLTGDKGMNVEDFAEVADQMRAIPGISNVVLDSPSDGIIEIAYNFNGLESLNASAEAQSKGEEDFSVLKFTSKGKNMTIDMTPSEEMTEGGDDMEGMVAMGEMLTYTINLNFERKIASVKSAVAQFDKDGNSIAFNISLSDLMDPKKKWITKVKFK